MVHLVYSPGQRGVTPTFGYGTPHPSARGTLTLLISALPSAHYDLLRLPAARLGFVRYSLSLPDTLYRPSFTFVLPAFCGTR